MATFATLLLAAYLSRKFSKTDWATYRQSFLVYTMAAPLLGMGLSKALFYFLPANEERNRGLLLENLIPLIFTGTCYLLFILLGGNLLIARLFGNPALEGTLLILAPLAIFSLIAGCVGPCLIASERVLTAAIFNLATQTAFLVFVFMAVFYSPTVHAAVWGRIIAAGLIFVAAIWVTLSVCRNGRPSIQGIGPQLAYGLPLGLSTMVNTFSRNIDRTMVSGYCTEPEYATFDNGALELPLVGSITGSMTSILIVDYRKMLDAGGQERQILGLLHRAMIKSATILIPCMFFLLLTAPEFMVCMFGDKYLDSAPVFRVYLLLLPVRTLTFSSIALAAGKTKLLACVPIVTVGINVVLNYFAIRHMGYIGCAFATVLVIYFVGTLGRALIATNVLGCSLLDFIPWSSIGLLMVIGASATFPMIVFRSIFTIGNPWLLLPTSGAIYLFSVTPMLCHFGFVNPQDIYDRLRKVLPGSIGS